jgi:hypothetical protein
MQKSKMLAIRIDSKLHKAARLKSVESGRPLSEIMRDLLAGWVDGSITLPQPTEAKPKRSKV